MLERILDKLLGLLARLTERFAPWHRLPFPLAVATLAGIRINMRNRNLYDCDTAPHPVPPQPHDHLHARTADGCYNDLAQPAMGMRGTRFGRNFPIAKTFGLEGKALLEPSPREISNKLLARKEFVPVPHLNLLVAAWLQFMVHDWMVHRPSPKRDPHSVPIADGDDWSEKPMSILRSEPDAPGIGDAGRPAAYTNTETHWWDGSQIYGSTIERQRLVRTDPATGELLGDGKLYLTPAGHLPTIRAEDDLGDAVGAKFPGQELAGVTANWWIGVSFLHTLFVREHNTIVDRLRADYPAAEGEWLFQKARLANAALMAKIHTTEWTPALMNSVSGRFIMRTNWWGVAGERFWKSFGRVSESELISGILGSATDHHSAPFSMTEEFVACYRMHPLIPDEFSFRSHDDDRELLVTGMAGVAHGNTAGVYAKVGFDDVGYSLGTSHPGALVLHNFPNFLRHLPEDPAKGIFSDLGAIDILRDRERGVPRYCEFRRLLGMKAPRTFEQLTANKQWQEEIAAIYPGVEDVDLLIGTLAESDGGTPEGFGFSDTVFRVFILMASRRLKSDRFFTHDFTPEVYTPAGFEWVADNTMATVLARHCPALRTHFADARNAFFPWVRGKDA